MMGRQEQPSEQLFYTFQLERHVPSDHLLRHIDAILDLSAIRRAIEPYYASTGRPSVDPELMIRMLLLGYAFGIRSERRLCAEVRLNLAYRWFCRLGLEGAVPDRLSRRTAMGVSARVTCSGYYSRTWFTRACGSDW
jgi:transposase